MGGVTVTALQAFFVSGNKKPLPLRKAASHILRIRVETALRLLPSIALSSARRENHTTNRYFCGKSGDRAFCLPCLQRSNRNAPLTAAKQRSNRYASLSGKAQSEKSIKKIKGEALIFPPTGGLSGIGNMIIYHPSTFTCLLRNNSHEKNTRKIFRRSRQYWRK